MGGVLGVYQSSTFRDSFWDPTTAGQSEATYPDGEGMVAGPMNAGTSNPGGIPGVKALTSPVATDFTDAGWASPPWQIPSQGWPTLQGPAAPVWTPPTLTPEPVTVGGISGDVIGNWGYNPDIAVDNGTYFGYIEERAAVEAGATFSGEGTNSSYLSAILDGSGAGLQQYVSAVQQGQFAALYQKLGIIPTWINNTVSIPQGVGSLVKDGAPALAIENYLVQMDGFSWAAAQAQAAAGFPIQLGS